MLSFLFGALEATQFDVDVAPPRCFWTKWGFVERQSVQEVKALLSSRRSTRPPTRWRLNKTLVL